MEVRRFEFQKDHSDYLEEDGQEQKWEGSVRRQFQGFIKQTGIQGGSYYNRDMELTRKWWTEPRRVRGLSDTGQVKLVHTAQRS